MSTSFHHSRSCSKAAFTLIELLVVISIMLVITSILLLQQSRFDSATLLRSLAYSVALSVRQAQVYGSSVRQISSGSAGGYGIYLNANTPTSYILFADIPTSGLLGDGRRTNSSEDIGQPFTLSNGFSINKFCATPISPPNTAPVCSTVITDLTIFFKRPNPDACFETSATPNACTPGQQAYYKSASIQLTGPSGNTRSVTISTTGQIVVGDQGS